MIIFLSKIDLCINNKRISSCLIYGVAVCGAPKRRFREYTPKVTKDANDLQVRKARKEQIKRDEAIGYIHINLSSHY